MTLNKITDKKEIARLTRHLYLTDAIKIKTLAIYPQTVIDEIKSDGKKVSVGR